MWGLLLPCSAVHSITLPGTLLDCALDDEVYIPVRSKDAQSTKGGDFQPEELTHTVLSTQ